MKFLGIQTCYIKSFDSQTSTTNIQLGIISRIIESETIEEAMGKFVIGTQNIYSEQPKQNPIVVKLDDVIRL